MRTYYIFRVESEDPDSARYINGAAHVAVTRAYGDPYLAAVQARSMADALDRYEAAVAPRHDSLTGRWSTPAPLPMGARL